MLADQQEAPWTTWGSARNRWHKNSRPWETFSGIDRRWHARIRGATPPIMVHDDDLAGLREEIIRKQSQLDERAWAEGRLSSRDG